MGVGSARPRVGICSWRDGALLGPLLLGLSCVWGGRRTPGSVPSCFPRLTRSLLTLRIGASAFVSVPTLKGFPLHHEPSPAYSGLCPGSWMAVTSQGSGVRGCAGVCRCAHAVCVGVCRCARGLSGVSRSRDP